ncbi:methyltransferase DDB_G0268948 [Pelobates cultripes]|uniref:Methyltransferase DDB_G0268948 n=1 Tax=Pelobates cultripes TaxID=61616 RepID=A0AAD1SSP9_PELCU|nr:methyltransferase DDB_G0268948 [Pelobates cultripes]
MTDHLFKSKTFSSVYQKYMVPVSTEVINLIFSYMEEKQKSKPYEAAVDVGCGPGRYTFPLAPYFKKVIGVDISEFQLEEAKQYCTLENVTFQVAAAENLPLEDSSVDLVNAGLAAHWFNVDKFVHEAIRVLKPNGCLAVHAFDPIFKLQDDRNDAALNAIVKQYLDKVSEFEYENVNLMYHQYEEVFNAIPLKEKKWITDIPVVYDMSIEEIIGFFQSIYMYQEFLKHDENEAIGFLMHLKQRFHDILGEGSESALIKLHCKHYCVLACKPSGNWRNNGLEN